MKISDYVPSLFISAFSSGMTSYYVVKSSKPFSMTGLLTLTHLITKVAGDYFYKKWYDWINPTSFESQQFTANSFGMAFASGEFATAKVVQYIGQKLNLEMPSLMMTLGILSCNRLISSIYENYYEIVTRNVFPHIRSALARINLSRSTQAFTATGAFLDSHDMDNSSPQA